MGTLLGLAVGIGIFLVAAAVLDPRPAGRTAREGPAGRLDSLLRGAGIEGVSAAGLVSLCGASGVAVFLLLMVVSQTAPVAVVFGLMASYAPIAVVRARARRRRRELAEIWPEAVDNLASAVRAGLSLPEALTQLGDRGPEALRVPFAAFGQDYLATGRFGDCLDRLKERLADPVGDRIVEALRIAREVGGGDLGKMLRSLSRFLREDARTRAELESRQAWVVNGARLAVASPWVVLLALSFQPEVIRRYASAGGVVVLAVGAGVCVVAYRLMLRLGRLPQERRVLS